MVWDTISLQAHLNTHTHTHTLNLREHTQNHSIKLDTSAEKEPIEMFLCCKQWQQKERAGGESECGPGELFLI